MADSIQALCEQGQAELIATDYLAAERHLALAEQIAWDARDWDALARLYMPLQEARRQRRQRALDGGFVSQILTGNSPPGETSAIPAGHALIAGAASIAPSIALRERVAESNRYVDVFLAATYKLNDESIIVIVPTGSVALPSLVTTIDRLLYQCPPHSVVIRPSEIPPTQTHMNDAAGGFVMDLWERLHRPFLAAADGCSDLVQRISAYRQTIAVDYACELAHQKLNQTAHLLARSTRAQST